MESNDDPAEQNVPESESTEVKTDEEEEMGIEGVVQPMESLVRISALFLAAMIVIH